MNDLTFANYENFFPASHQMTDVNSLAQNIEYDEVPPTFHYLSNVSCDIAPLSQNVVAEQMNQQGSMYNFISNTHEEQPQNNRLGTGGPLGNVGSSGGLFGNIPFVQIHTTDVQPQRTNYGNVFRRNISKQEEIKSEPIKSENAETAKDRANATPTPPRPNNQALSENNLETLAANKKQSVNANTHNLEEKSSSVLQIYKCSKCPFISLSQIERDSHVTTQQGKNICSENEQRQPIHCIGCSNIFFNQKSMEAHLKLDHLLEEAHILKLINALIETRTSTAEKISNHFLEPANNVTNMGACNEPVRKSRIYLKNVDCLREPNRQPIEQTDNQLTETSSNHVTAPKKTNSAKQKISIKSVDVLREPALLRRNYEIQSPDLNNFINFNSELLSSPLNLNTANSYDYNQSLEDSANKTNLGNDGNSLVNSSKSLDVAETAQKPRRPKIYVKSVESFNLMPLHSLDSTNNTAYLNTQSSSNNNTQVYDSNVGHLAYMFDSNSSGNNLNSNTSFVNNHNEMDAFQFINTPNSNNNYVLDNSLFSGNSADLGENCDQMENITLIPDKTTNQTEVSDINIIMNKPISTTQEQRGTLHLRTVDELNLMNKTEVQHLIAPNLDNNHSSDVLDKVNASGLHEINLIGDDLYEDGNFKFHDLDTQMVNDWPETYEDLAEDINCMIARDSNENSVENLVYAASTSNEKMGSSNFDIDTPQVSLITIRDIEDLTGTANQTTIHNVADHQQDSVVEQIQDCHSLAPTEIDIANQDPLISKQNYQETVSNNNLKQELVNANVDANETVQVTKMNKTNEIPEIANTTPASTNEMPPLVPVTNTVTDLSDANLQTNHITPLPNSSIPLPPLVPVSPTIKLKSSANIPFQKTSLPQEKGRIYVANNLMEPPKRPIAVSATSGTSVRGRPFGSNHTRITKLKQTIGSSAEDLFSKCSFKGCAFRFKKPETVEYHRKCHDTTSDNPHSLLCPECKSTEFNNWNTLHTHLWRAHQIDMELYKCELCDFKTPIFSRLVNTHAKIHFDDRNYKCEQCGKAFKNSKQLKNHRRWHRVQTTASGVTNVSKATPTEIHRCSDCGSTFSLQKTLREHCCKKGDSSLKCSVCEKLMSSKSSLKLHLLIHSDGEKRYKCQNCDYATNDHNAFRRHRMGHENRKMYECNFCSYKSVQSVAYQKHILQKHPEKADSVIHKCSACSFSTINRSLLIVHQAKHEQISEDLEKTKNADENSLPKIPEKSVNISATELQKSKIKVKSNLFSTNVHDSLSIINNSDLNLVQLYNAESGNVT